MNLRRTGITIIQTVLIVLLCTSFSFAAVKEDTFESFSNDSMTKDSVSVETNIFYKSEEESEQRDAEYDISTLIIDQISDEIFTGKAIKPVPIIMNGTYELTKDVDYAIKYKNNKKVGTATVIMTGKGDYYGTAETTFKIIPRGTSIKKATVRDKSITTEWKKNASCSGYQIRCSADADFNSCKIKTLKSKNKTKYTFTGLSACNTYYIQIRTILFKRGTKHYSKWSRAKSYKTKAPKLTNKKALALYKKADTVAHRWLFSGCYYMDNNYDNILSFEENGETVYAIPIKHKSIDSVKKLRKYLSNYFTIDVYDDTVAKNYRDIDGKLYFASNYGLGGPYGYKIRSVKIKSQNNGTVKVKVKINEVEYYNRIRQVLSRNVKLVYKEGKWLFKKPFYIVDFGGKIPMQN